MHFLGVRQVHEGQNGRVVQGHQERFGWLLLCPRVSQRRISVLCRRSFRGSGRPEAVEIAHACWRERGPGGTSRPVEEDTLIGGQRDASRARRGASGRPLRQSWSTAASSRTPMPVVLQFTIEVHRRASGLIHTEGARMGASLSRMASAERVQVKGLGA